MASEREEAGNTGGVDGLSIAESIRQIAAKNARAELSDEKQLELFLRSWWSRLYNRPLKDPLLQEYTLEDLLYEFYDRIERRAAEEERQKQGEIDQEVAKEKADLDWAEKMEQEELAQMKAKAAAEEAAKKVDPTKDPENVKWMEEQMRIAKEQFGDTFGEDVELKFDDK
jgi:hypothetical protein